MNVEKNIAKSYLKELDIKMLGVEKIKEEKLCTIIAISLQRMWHFPLIKIKETYPNNIIFEKKGLSFLKNHYVVHSETLIEVENECIINIINNTLKPPAEENCLFLEALTKIMTIFKLKFTSKKEIEFSNLMWKHYLEKINQNNEFLLLNVQFPNEILLNSYSNVLLSILIKENDKKEFSHFLYPISLVECANLLTISGTRIKKLKLMIINDYSYLQNRSLYYKILTMEIDQFYEWTEDFSDADVIISDDRYLFLSKKKIFLMSPFSSEEEINKIQKELLVYINIFDW